MRLDGIPIDGGLENADLLRALQQRAWGRLRTVLHASALVLAGATLAALATRSAALLWIYAAFALPLATALALDFGGRKREASAVVSLGYWVAATAAVFLLGGVRSPGSFAYLPIVITAGVFWSWRAATVLAAASLAAVSVAALLEGLGALPFPVQPATAGLLLQSFAGSLAMTAVLVGVTVYTLHEALDEGRRQAARTEELLLQVPHVLAVLDRLGVVRAVGPAMHERTGYEHQELIGQHISRLELFGQDRQAVADDLRLLAGRDGEAKRKVPLRCKDGALALGEARVHTVALDNGGTASRIVLYESDDGHRTESRRDELDLRGEKSAKAAPVLDLGSELATLSPMLSRMAGDELSLAIRIHGEPCFVRMDKLSLKKIATNLIVNARSTTSPGGEIVVELAHSFSPGAHYPTPRAIELSVTGSGIDPDFATPQQLLEAGGTTNDAINTGLSLTTVSYLVSRLGGTVQVDRAAYGIGPTVRVLLPEASSSDVTAS